MSIKLVRAGRFRDVTEIAVLYQGRWRTVLIAQVLHPPPAGSTKPVWKVAYDRYQPPPTNLRGGVATHSSAEITWEESPKATEYQVIVQSRAPGAPTFSPMDPPPPTTEFRQTINGLSSNMEYSFTVVAKRPVVGGKPVVSPPSNAIILDTGYTSLTLKNPSYDLGTGIAGADLVYINAARTDTWNSDYHWGDKTGGPDVRQGFSSSAYRSRNAHGVVDYTTARAQLDAEVKRVDPAPLRPVNLDEVTVVEAKIDSIYRKSGGSGTPTIHIYPWKALYSTARPLPAGGTTTGTTFAAPGVGKFKDELDLGKLLGWAQEWIKNPSAVLVADRPKHNAMLIFNSATTTGNTTAGYNGYAILRAARASSAASSEAEWRLKLWVRWNYTLPAKDPAWQH